MKGGTAATLGFFVIVPLCTAFPPLIFPLLLVLVIASAAKK